MLGDTIFHVFELQEPEALEFVAWVGDHLLGG